MKKSFVNSLSMRAAAAFVFVFTIMAMSAFAQTINFESPAYTVGDINGQDGWLKTGSFDAAVSTSSVVGFGSQSFRISNAVTSGSFGDQTFSKPLANEAGETGADNGGYSGGVRKRHFTAQWDFTSSTGAHQPSLQIAASPDRGDGATMGQLRMLSEAGGLRINYLGFNPGLGCGGWYLATVATGLAHDQVHTVRMEIDFVNGPGNDVMRVYVNGTLGHTGTTMEAFHTECSGAPAPPTVDSILFRASNDLGTAPDTAGNGFLIDNFSLTSSNVYVVDDDGAQCPSAGYNSIQAAIVAASAGDIIQVCPGTYNESPQIDKSLALVSTGGRDVTTIQFPAVTNARIRIVNAATPLNVTIDGFTIRGNDGTAAVAPNDGIRIDIRDGHNTTIINNRFQIGMMGGWTGAEGGRGIITTSNTALNMSLHVEGNIFEPLTLPGGEGRRAFYVNPGVGAFTFRNNQVTGRFAAISITQARNGLVEGNTVTGDGTAASQGLGTWGYSNPVTPGTGTTTFRSNTITGTNAGLAIVSTSDVSILENTLTGNQRGIHVYTQTAPEGSGTVAHFNRIANNNIAGITNDTANPVDAENNWWGCNYGPGVAGVGCPATPNGVVGAVDASPWLTLTTAADPDLVIIPAQSTVTSKLVWNSDGVDTTGLGSVPNTTPANFAGTGGTVSPSNTTLTSGVATTTFTPTTAGSGNVATTVDGMTVYAPINVQNECATISTTVQTPFANTDIVVPINTDDLTGRGVISYTFTVTYNPAAITYTGYNTAGTLSSDFLITINDAGPGVITIVGYGTVPLSGAGSLIDLNFTTGAIGGSSQIDIGDDFVYNEGIPCIDTVTDGSVTIVSGTISGKVTYLNAIGNPNPRPVPDTLVSADGSIDVSDLTDGNGDYSLSGMGTGEYTVTPSKSGGLTPLAISGGDAAAIAQHLASITPLNDNQLIAADVSGNGTVTAFDAALIAQWVASIPNPGSTGTWRFLPTHIDYDDVTMDYLAENYAAVLMGDVTGNWGVTPLFSEPAIFDSKNAIRVDLGNVSAEPGSEIVIPVSIQDLTGKSVNSYQFDLEYDPEVLEPHRVAADLAETISTGMTVISNSPQKGLLKVVVFGALPIEGAGNLVNLRFTAVGTEGNSSTLTIREFYLNEGGLETVESDGEVFIKAASGAVINGRLLTAYGTPVEAVYVSLTATSGKTRRVLSDEAGRFVFGGLSKGETYTVRVDSGRHTFAPQTVGIADRTTSLDMIAEQ